MNYEQPDERQANQDGKSKTPPGHKRSSERYGYQPIPFPNLIPNEMNPDPLPENTDPYLQLNPNETEMTAREQPVLQNYQKRYQHPNQRANQGDNRNQENLDQTDDGGNVSYELKPSGSNPFLHNMVRDVNSRRPSSNQPMQ